MLEIEKLNEFLSELRNLYNGKYVSFSDLEKVKEKFSDFSLEKREIRKQKMKLLFRFRFRELFRFSKKIKTLKTFLEKREELNSEFIKNEQATSSTCGRCWEAPCATPPCGRTGPM